MGGEKQNSSSSGASLPGSPPRGRGKASGISRKINCHGITPAWAGKSTWSPSFKDLRQDHPRVGGEKPLRNFTRNALLGSLPRGRGKDDEQEATYFSGRITPAWAGKRLLSMLDCAAFWDHPRVGGEKGVARWMPSAIRGSPPRGRGKVVYLSVSIFSLRITPAWAGKSFSITARGRVRRDHPRVGGEKGR